jgi:hypothetical protein
MKNIKRKYAEHVQEERLKKVVVKPLAKQIRKHSIRGMNMSYLIWSKLRHHEELLDVLARGIARLSKEPGDSVIKS